MMIKLLCHYLLLWSTFMLSSTTTFCFAQDVIVEVLQDSNGPPVVREQSYKSMVTLYIEQKDGTKTPSGWSTRVEHGAPQDTPFEFQPGVGLIEGWTEGVLQMKQGQRALLHVPSLKGYGSREAGTPGGAFYIPANSNLLFDIEILEHKKEEL